MDQTISATMSSYTAVTVAAVAGVVATGVCLASNPRFVSYLYNKTSSVVATWFRTEVDKGKVDALKEDVQSKISKRAWKKISKLDMIDLEGVFSGDDNDLEFVPLAYKYSRIARVELCCPIMSEANKKCAYHLIRKAMLENNVRQHQILKSIHLAVALTFVKDADEMEASHILDLLNPLVEKSK
nr:hypothetical protein 1 [Ginkgo biloba tombusvirus]